MRDLFFIDVSGEKFPVSVDEHLVRNIGALREKIANDFNIPLTLVVLLEVNFLKESAQLPKPASKERLVDGHGSLEIRREISRDR